MFRLGVPATVLALLIASGVIEGVWSNRWHLQDDSFKDHAERINRLPVTIGDWDYRPQPEEAKWVPKEQRDSSIVRTYINRVNGNVVAIFLTYGAKGPLCFNHTPLGCYPSNGYKLVGTQDKFALPPEESKKPAQFWVARFSKIDAPVPHHVRVFWSWSGSGEWLAPDSPRLAFAAYSGLYKIYLTRDLASPQDRLEADPCIEFMRVLLPELQKTLFSES